jgi:hypothetical protein
LSLANIDSTFTTMTKQVLLLIVFIIKVINVQAQGFFALKNYPKSAFASPVKIPLSLAGNFGECRPNHFHSGLDVRTNKVENIPIYAIADGYISRVKIEEKGFGNAIYITHGNGYTSLYAHLNNFYPALENYIRKLQYQNKSWKIDQSFMPHEFLIRKGNFLAYSGNTGSSQAPHLHMEIRNSKTDKPLNGLLFYNMPDTKAPLVKKLAVYDAHKSIYAQSPKQYTCIKKGNLYLPTTDTIITNTNYAALGIVADDPMENALGVLGVYELNMYVDNNPYFGWQLDNIGYDETRYMNAQADYTTKKNGGPWIQLCYQQAGDKLGIYKNFTKDNGRINLSDGNTHAIKLIIKDVAGNYSEMRFWIKARATSTAREKYNMLVNKENTFSNSNIAFNLSKDALYDDVPFSTAVTSSNNIYSNIYKVGNNAVPVHTYFDLKLKPKINIPENLKTKVAMVRLPSGKETDKKGKAASYDGTWVKCSVRDFGTYEIVIDQTAPSITTSLTNGATLKNNKIIITAKDETTTVANFIGKIDGAWVRFQQKGNSYIYEVDQYCTTGKHQLDISAIDENGNTKNISIAFIK